MRTASFGGLAVASAVLLSCSSSEPTPGMLSFTVAESLLVLMPSDPTFAYALLSSGTGSCAALQAGIAPGEIGNVNYLFAIFESVDINDMFAPVTAASYNIIDPQQPPSQTLPALIAYSSIIETDNLCNYGGANASSGTATLNPFNSADGGSSTLNYTAIYGGTQLTGTSVLTTCLLSATIAEADAGTCIPCTGPGDGGACTIQ